MRYCFGAYCFEPARYALTHAGTPVPLRPKGCELLAYLLMSAGLTEVEEAQAYYRQALAMAEGLGMRPLQAHCHR
jgi:hypothetical protein